MRATTTMIGGWRAARRALRATPGSARYTSAPCTASPRTGLANLILLCPRHHTLLHDRHIRTSGTGDEPAFANENGRAITTNQPHAP